MKQRDLWIVERSVDCGDCYGRAFLSEEEARKWASAIWSHLTKGEKADSRFWLYRFEDFCLDGEEANEAYLRLIDGGEGSEENAVSEEELFGTCGDLMEYGDFHPYCIPYETETGTPFCVFGEDIIIDGGKAANEEELHALAVSAAGEWYSAYKGWSDAHILTENAYLVNEGCVSCPFFSDCEAMREWRG